MFKPNALYYVDAYKVGHKKMLAKGTTRLYGTWIPRSVKYAPKGVEKIVSFGQQLVVKWLHDLYQESFFDLPKEDALLFCKDMSVMLGMDYDGSHFEELYDLGYLPIKIKSLPEGIETQPNIPHMTFVNTVDGFGWLTLFLETIISSLAWKPTTSATIALQYKRNLVEWLSKTDPSSLEMASFLCHDFSARGLSPWDMMTSSLGHATSFRGSDTIVTIPAARYFYGEPKDETIINSVNASEHSVSTTKIFTVGEKQMLIDWMKDFPSGILSIVADTFSLWDFIEYCKELKEEILSRDGKIVCRPDCYSDDTSVMTNKGWKLFKDLNPHTDLVAQVLDDGSYSFVKPLKYINQEYEGKMVHYFDHHGKIDLLVTPNHRMLYDTGDGYFKEQEAKDCSFFWKKDIRRSALAENKGLKLSPKQALKIAFQADGSYTTSGNKIRFSFSKQRKTERLESILKDCNLKYKIYDLKDNRVEFNIDTDASLFVKDFSWVNTESLCSNWCQEFIEELSYWDATRRHDGRFKFDTTTKSVIEKVELVAMSAGYGILISENKDNRKDIFSDVYTAHIMMNNKLGGQSIKKEIVDYKGNVVCVKVPTGKIVVKRNRGQLVCGNSGDPVDIICGTTKVVKELPDDSCYDVIYNGKHYTDFHTKPWENRNWIEKKEIKPKEKGVVELLWDIFGGTVNEQGYKVLDPHIGLIYGDAITVERQVEIYKRLEAKGFATSNVVLGIGSFTYQMNTRDTLGFAAKGAQFTANGENYNIYKDPITDDGTKTSLKGYQAVFDETGNGDYFVQSEVSDEMEDSGELRTIYEDGEFYNQTTLTKIRERLNG